jgi:hypothetical protein
MILLIRRMVLLVSLMFWQGGFMFYGGVVVSVGGRILGSETHHAISDQLSELRCQFGFVSGQWSVAGCFGADRFFRAFLAASRRDGNCWAWAGL